MKIQKGKIGTWISLILFFLIGLIFIVEAILLTVCIKDLRDGEEKTYQGSYEITRKDFLRDTRYVFTLDNGDTFAVDAEHLANKDVLIETNSELRFLYSSHKSLFSGCYTGISVVSLDESIIFVQESAVKEDMKGGVLVYFIIGIPTVLFAVLLILCQLPLFSCLSLMRRRFRTRRKVGVKTAQTKPK